MRHKTYKPIVIHTLVHKLDVVILWNADWSKYIFQCQMLAGSYMKAAPTVCYLDLLELYWGPWETRGVGASINKVESTVKE